LDLKAVIVDLYGGRHHRGRRAAAEAATARTATIGTAATGRTSGGRLGSGRTILIRGEPAAVIRKPSARHQEEDGNGKRDLSGWRHRIPCMRTGSCCDAA
jgi:hypothetical protein